jgi:hypothetical protein
MYNIKQQDANKKMALGKERNKQREAGEISSCSEKERTGNDERKDSRRR